MRQLNPIAFKNILHFEIKQIFIDEDIASTTKHSSFLHRFQRHQQADNRGCALLSITADIIFPLGIAHSRQPLTISIFIDWFYGRALFYKGY